MRGDAQPYRLSVDIDALPPPALATHATGIVVGAEVERLMTNAAPDTLGGTTFVISGDEPELQRIFRKVRRSLHARWTEDGVEFVVEHSGYDWPWRVTRIDNVAQAADAFASMGNYVYNTGTRQLLIPSAE